MLIVNILLSTLQFHLFINRGRIKSEIKHLQITATTNLFKVHIKKDKQTVFWIFQCFIRWHVSKMHNDL